MILDRRTFLATGLASAAAAFLPGAARAAFSPRPGAWNTFEVTTRIDLAAASGAAQVWVPVPAVSEPDWARPGDTRWSGNMSSAALVTDGANEARYVHATWDDAGVPPRLEVTSVASARDRATDLTRPSSPVPLSPDERARYTAATALIPTDGIVRETSDRITAGAVDDLEKAQAIYDWIVQETARDPDVRGCGLGDVGAMLEIGDLTGKCADLNALFVGLARAAGLPARDVYGLRVAPSEFGYASLGAKSPDVTGAQHCRADVYLDRSGWVAADPADVRKVMLEEPPRDLSLSHPKVVDARKALFGAWEGNWIAYNFAHDVVLPGLDDGALPFLMYPEGQVAGRRLDPLDPDAFGYTITATRIGG